MSDLAVDTDFVADRHLTRLYCLLHEGKITTAFTRLPISAIASGYYERRSNRTVLVSNLKSEYVASIGEMIRKGHRPTLDVYWNPLGPDGGRYVCADDETALRAYSSLNVTLVPCKILRPRKVSASEASIWVKKSGDHVRLARAVPPTVNGYASVIGNVLLYFPDLVRVLIGRCASTREAIIEFHRHDGSGVHYHQMLHALLRRHERILDSICQLVTLRRVEHASALTRVAYEAFLNFYVDWLAPEFFGSRLQLLSYVREAQSHGSKTLDDSLEVLTNFVEFLANASNKARISPLGSFFHNTIYPPLSLVAHQTYIHLEHEASDFHETDLPDPPSRVEQLGRWLDVLTAALLVRVNNDIGISTTLSSATTSGRVE